MLFAAEGDHPVVDGLRLFDVVLGVILAVALLYYAWMFVKHITPMPHAIMAALSSWWLLNFSGVLTSIARLGEEGDARLPIRLLGHMIGLAFVFTAHTMVREGRRPL